MTFKEFFEYKKSILKEAKVEKDGTLTGDNNVRFKLFFGDVAKEQIVAKTVGEAVYRSCILLLIDELSDIVKNNIDSDDKLQSLSGFASFKGSVCVDGDHKYIEITHYDKKYILKVAESENNSHIIDDVLDIVIDDNIIKVWYKYDKYTIICDIVNSPASLVKYEIVKDMPLDQKQNIVMQYLRLVSASITHYLGFSSINYNSDEIDYDSFSDNSIYEYGKSLSYKRAILDKINIDSVTYKYLINESSKSLRDLIKSKNKFSRIVRTLSKRKNQIKKSINDMTENIFDYVDSKEPDDIPAQKD